MRDSRRLRLRDSLHLDQDATLTLSATALPTFEFTSSILTVDVGSCCQSTEPPTARPTTSSSPSQPPGPIPSSQRLPALAIAAITVAGALLLFAVTGVPLAYRRRAVRRRGAEKMHHHVKGHAVAAAKPDTPPPSQPVPPSIQSPLSTLSLSDQGFCREALGLSSRPRSPFDRWSVDTTFAFSFYASPEPERHFQAPSIAELPTTPCHRPVPAPPPTPPSSTTPPRQTQPFPWQKQASQAEKHLQPTSKSWISVPPPATPPPQTQAFPERRRASQRPTTYLNPAGEPWVSVPPPAVPLPAPPRPRRAAPRTHEPRSRPTFSLFPSPPHPNSHPHHHRPPTQPRPTRPKLHVPAQDLNQTTTSTNNNPAKRTYNFSRPSPMALPPPPHTARTIPTCLTPALGPLPAPASKISGLIHSGLGSGTCMRPPTVATAANRGRRPGFVLTTHFPPPPGVPGGSSNGGGAGGRKSLPNRLWTWRRGGLGFG
ncbi:hypothetical protein N658DRAFT_138751 [Parathielavia hyrcaniae]|uniref:Uncharacterized protein n=1 Tax=Parathielavia hyrcaniae TaxID=113614 RepID=A0AAN6T104_9PEZI|nr:hypothetical protein N658DRAFT_138751 [Parathielavia hyrcaniae]